MPPAIEVQSLKHWTAREVPASFFFLNKSKVETDGYPIVIYVKFSQKSKEHITLIPIKQWKHRKCKTPSEEGAEKNRGKETALGSACTV